MCENLIFTFFTGAFVASGFGMLGVGFRVLEVYNDYDVFLESGFISLANMSIVIGTLVFALILLLAIVACCPNGSKGQSYLSMLLGVLLIVLCVFELYVGIRGFILKSSAASDVQASLTANFNEAKKGNSSSWRMQQWDKLQEEFKCCGANSSADWAPLQLPPSCCLPDAPSDAFSPFLLVTNSTTVCTEEEAYKIGCIEGCGNYMLDLGTISTVFGVIQLLSILLIVCVCLGLYATRQKNQAQYERV